MKNPKNLKAITLAVTASQDEVSNELGDFTNSDISLSGGGRSYTAPSFVLLCLINSIVGRGEKSENTM